MARKHRRLRNLNLEEEEDIQPTEHGNLSENENEDNLQGLNENDDGLQGLNENDDDLQGQDENNDDLQVPPDVDGLLARLPRHLSRTAIKIIWPNGAVRQVLGDFGISNIGNLRGGKIIVGTDENGVPNERSASILGQYLGQLAEKPSLAPLHIERWDNELFNTHKEQIIRDVEKHFHFPRQMLNLTRDWVLRTVNNRWRSYKSKLKKQHVNREERSLEEILKGKPHKVNELQWKALVGFWCREQHKKICATNTRTAKEQKNTHTSGRKSHARLKKEMEDDQKRKVNRLELLEATHKKKNGRYTTDKVDSVMNASCVELEKRKQTKNGNLSAQDFNEVFNEIVAKELKTRGYYDDKYWSELRVSQGVTFVTQTEEERRYQEKVNAMENKMQRMGGLMKHWLGFMLKKFPEEDFIKEMIAGLHDEDGLIEPESHSVHSPALSIGNVHSPTNDVQHETFTEDHTSLPSEQRVAKQSNVQNSIHEDNSNSTSNLSQDPILTNMRFRRVKAPSLGRPESSRYPVYLLSLRNKGRVVAKGKLVTANATREIGGVMLGKEYFGVYVEGLENIDSRNKGDELIPRPIFEIRTLTDAIGYIIPWPCSHVKRDMCSNLKQPSQRRSEAAMEIGEDRGKNGQ